METRNPKQKPKTLIDDFIFALLTQVLSISYLFSLCLGSEDVNGGVKLSQSTTIVFGVYWWVFWGKIFSVI